MWPQALAPASAAQDGIDMSQLTSLAAPSGLNLPKVTVGCPNCGQQQQMDSHTKKCENCDHLLKHPASSGDESPFVGYKFGTELQEQTLNLADSSPDDEDTATGSGNDDPDNTDPTSVQCPKCGELNPWEEGSCKHCGASLAAAKAQALNASEALAAERESQILHLSEEQLGQLALADNTAQRKEWRQKGWTLPDLSWPIPNVAYLKKAIQAFPGRAKGQEGKIKNWILKHAKRLNYTGEDLKRVADYSTGTDAGQEHNATLMALDLDHTQGDQGLIWKVLCKTGTLALSPGPGQMDTDKPLNLTADMFQAVKQAYDERALEHVTIPETHSNGTLENTGTVDALEILSQPQALADVRLSQKTKEIVAQDPHDTLYMLGGMRFTEPKVREKAQNGSILNCSVGLKFNYRRKRDGKLFPLVLEHTALTNQPWVDGLGAFGTDSQLSQPFDQDKLPVWDGVFVSPQSGEPVEDGGTFRSASLPLSVSAAELPSVEGSDTSSGTEPQVPSLEQILASQTAETERLRAELNDANRRLGLSQEQIKAQGKKLHTSQVNERIQVLQSIGVPPAVLMRYKSIALAAYEPSDEGKLQLSVKEGDSTVVKDMDLMDTVEYLLAAMPLISGDGERGNLYDVTTKLGAEALSLSQESHERVELSAEQKADELEKRLHPERFDSEGKRIPLDQRRPGRAA